MFRNKTYSLYFDSYIESEDQLLCLNMTVTLYYSSCIHCLCLMLIFSAAATLLKILGFNRLFYIVDPYYFERNGLYIGQGTTMLSRARIFRASQGIAVDMNNQVFKLPSFHGISHALSWTCRNFAIDLWFKFWMLFSESLNCSKYFSFVFTDVLEGEIFLQNLPSIVAAHALGIYPIPFLFCLFTIFHLRFFVFKLCPAM